MQVRLEEQASEPGQLEIYEDSRLPGLRKGIHGKPGIPGGAEILQPVLCQQGSGGGEEKTR